MLELGQVLIKKLENKVINNKMAEIVLLFEMISCQEYVKDGRSTIILVGSTSGLICNKKQRLQMSNKYYAMESTTKLYIN